MKEATIMNKIMVLAFLILVSSSTIAATEYSTGNGEIIHSVTIAIKGLSLFDVYLSTKVGNMRGGVCQYTKETTSLPYPFKGPQTIYYLNGVKLTQLVGLGYDCAATHARADTPGREEGVDSYLLVGDGKSYVNTVPREGVIKLPITGSHL